MSEQRKPCKRGGVHTAGMGGGRAARLRQGMADVKVLKGLLAREARSQFISRRQTVQPAPVFYCAASSVTPLHPPFFAQLSCAHGVSRNSDDFDNGGLSRSQGYRWNLLCPKAKKAPQDTAGQG